MKICGINTILKLSYYAIILETLVRLLLLPILDNFRWLFLCCYWVFQINVNSTRLMLRQGLLTFIWNTQWPRNTSCKSFPIYIILDLLLGLLHYKSHDNLIVKHYNGIVNPSQILCSPVCFLVNFREVGSKISSFLRDLGILHICESGCNTTS